MADWDIDGNTAVVNDVTLTPKQLSLSFDADRDDIDTWRAYETVGDFSVETRYGGSFQVVGRGGASSVSVTPPNDMQPPFQSGLNWWPQSYQERQVAPDRWEISLGLHRDSDRVDEYSTVTETGDWELDLNSGTIALNAVDVRPDSQSGAAAGATRSLTCRLNDDQAATFIDNAGRPDGVVERGLAAAANEYVDESSGRHTVTVSSPSGATLSGEHLITGWRLSWLGYQQQRWQVELTLWETRGPTIPSELTNRWKIDEGSGTSLSDSIGSDTATINGATWVSDATATGGEKLDHDGTDDYIDAPTDINATDYSALAWFQFDDKNSTNDIMTGTDTSNDGFRLTHDTGGDDLRLAHIAASFNVVTTAGDITTGDWYMVAVTGSGDSADLYLYDTNGLVQKNSGSGSRTVTSSSLRLMSHGGLQKFGDGDVDDAAVAVGTNLSDSEVQDYWSATVGSR